MTLRVALCQLDPTVGDLDGNARLVAESAHRAAAGGADLAVFPELVLLGYPPKDLLERASLVDRQRAVLGTLAAELPPGLVALVGFADVHGEGAERRLFNAAAVLRGGRLAGVVHKRLLPTYDVFDEDRYFEEGDGGPVVEVAGVRVGVTICEDIWNDVDVPIAARRYPVNPIADVVDAGAEVVVNLSASPFTVAKRVARPEMLAAVARKHGVPVVFVNQVGGNDDLLFDGSSAIFGDDGEVWASCAAFTPCEVLADVAPGGPRAEWPGTDEAALVDALALGVRDYARKCGFRRVVLGVSGGIDSALVAALAARALGPDAVLGVAMPTRYSSEGSLTDARALCDNLGVAFREIPIEPMFEPYLAHLGPHLDDLGAAPAGDVTFENVQSRIRCATLMAISNRTGALLLTTGNKSELAVGYCTLYGDMAGGLAVISDLPKTTVYRVARELNRQAGRELVPESTLTKPPSAELREDQKDEDSLPPYDVLDPILERLVERHASVDEVVADGFDRGTVAEIARLVFRNEYKRRQLPPGLIVTRKAFGPGRRYPIASRW